jgi:hypothetical protein
MSERKNRKVALRKPHIRRNRPNRFTSDELVLQPWFLPRQSRLAINSLIPHGYRNKMRAYFDDYGCMICGGMNLLYSANGMCTPCFQTVLRRLRRSVKRRITGKPDNRADLFMMRRAKLAKKLFGTFSSNWRSRLLRHRLDAPLSNNPVDEALGLLSPNISRDTGRIPDARHSHEEGIWSKSIRDLPTNRPRR